MTGLESYLPWLGPSATVTDYLPDGTARFLDGSAPAQGAVRSAGCANCPDCGRAVWKRTPPCRRSKNWWSPPAALASRTRLRHVFLAGSWIAGDEQSLWLERDPAARSCVPVHRASSCGAATWPQLRADLLDKEKQGQTVLLLCDNKGQADRLADLLDDTDDVPPVDPAAGWDPCPRVLSGPKRAWPASPITNSSSVTSGPPVPGTAVRAWSRNVPPCDPGNTWCTWNTVSAGTAGLEVITVQGGERECLVLEYAEEGKVFVPVENIDQVERYSSDQGANPPLARLGSGSWLKVKGRARKAIQAMAAELIELYAARKARPGLCFSLVTRPCRRPWRILSSSRKPRTS